MSDDPNRGAQNKKLSTKEILAAARAAAAAKAAGGAPPAHEPESADEPALAATHETPAATPAESPAPAAQKPAPKAAGGKPSSTAEILAAARAAAAAKNEGAAAPAAGAEKKAAAPKAAPAGAPGAKPKSTADILAAARAAAAAKGAGGAAPAAAPADKPTKASPAKAGAAAVKGEAAAEGGAKLSVQEMLAAVRPASTAAAETATEPKAPAKAAAAALAAVKPLPPKPAPSKSAPGKKGAAEPSQGRRWFLLGGLMSAFSIAWTAVIATTTIATLGMARFMLPNVLTEPPRKFKIGSPSDYDLGTVATKWVAAFGIWVVHTDQYKGRNLVYALLSVCTHLGCTPSWLEGEQKFKCPCHGSGFYISGINFEGPAPRPLERVGIRIAEDGMLEVDKSVRFQEEMGQWADPNSYVEMA